MIQGKRVTIRPLEPEDAAILTKWWNSHETMSHAGFPCGLMRSLASIEEEVLAECKKATYADRRRMLICQEERPIGEISYSSWDRRNRSVEFGIKIAMEEDRGKGWGSEALGLWINYLFATLAVDRIHLSTMPDNLSAHALYRKLGFQEYGRARKAYFDARANDYVDMVLMDLLREEWTGYDIL